MRIKYPNIVRLLMVLAMVCGLVAVVAAPASADIAANPTVTPGPATASDAAGYTVAFTTGAAGALVAGVGTITITFPADTVLPSSIAKENLSVSGTVCTSAAAVNITTRTVTVITPVAVANSTAATVVISQVAGIKNPSFAAATYTATVYTSAETNPVTTVAYSIYPTLAISSATGARGAVVTVTGKGWTANQAVTIGNALSGAGTILADGTFSVSAVAVQSGAVTCRDGSGKGTFNSTAITKYALVNVPEPAYILKATVTVSPTSGPVGTVVTITGTDFTQYGNITATTGITLAGTTTWANPFIDLDTRDAYSDNDDFITTLTIPATIGGGAKTVSVTDTSAKNATATFTVNTPTITLNPTSGAPNTMVTITGANFKAADTIPATTGLTFAAGSWNGTAVITVDASGGWNFAARVPSAAVPGTNPVIATSTLGTYAVTAFVVGTRVLTITPPSGPIGTTVTVTGANMTVGGHMHIGEITFATVGWNAAQVDLDSLGNFIATSLQVPAGATTGPKTVAATDSGGLIATGTFTVTQPTITISPSTGYKGDSITVTGAGWVPGNLGLVMVQFAGNTLAVSTPDANGSFTGILTVPVNAAASSFVGATDINGNTAAAKIFLLGSPMISLAPTSGAVGTKVTITGVGLAPQVGLSALTIGGVPVLPTAPVVTSSIGKFSAELTVPGLAEGAQVVSATVVAAYTAFFTITAAPASVDVQLASISDKLVIVWGYYAGAWTYYDPADPVKTLASLAKNRGYWIKVNADCTLVYGGSSIALTTGWNNIGWPE